MPQLAIAKEFLTEFAALEKPVRERVIQVFAKFEQATHTGLHLEKINNARDGRFRTIRIDQFYRGVLLAPESGDTYLLLKVLPHDDAYHWAKTRRATVNRATGGIELRDVAALDASLPHLERLAQNVPTRLFEDVSDADLRRLGVDEQTMVFAQTLTDVFQLEAARGLLPAIQWEVLYGLAAGLTPEQVWEEMGAAIVEGEVDPEDLDAAVRRSPDRVLLVEGPEELTAALETPFDLWRIYLHPAQRAVVEASYGGPARVSGGPGTGKTVVALHRARELAEREEGEVLLTTFTSTLAAALEAQLRLLVESQSAYPEELLGRIRVEHVDRLAHRVFREVHGQPDLLDQGRERRLWQEVVDALGVDLSPSFLAAEWRQVVLARRVENAQAYLEAKRTGRGRGLNAARKAQVWQAVHSFRNLLTERGLWTHETVGEEAARILAGRTEKPFRHVVVDEAQDLHAGQWRLLRAAVAEDRDDLFIAGDTHQRVYGPKVSLAEVGVNILGRSSKLRINYRTTAQILGWSLGLVLGEPVDDMDGGLDSIAGCRSEIRGEEPALHGAATWEAELGHLKETVSSWVEAGVLPEEIGVAARSNHTVDQAVLALEEAGLSARSLARGQVPDAVSVGTMHRMKGLEFRCLAVVGAGGGQLPAPRSVTPEQEDPGAHARDLLRERSLLFVACTRAREQLSVSWHRAPSPFLEAVLDR
ncbi:DNA helicase [Nocardiopsis terrae]|uniref:DNA 3'-5' helicase n=1 Tax=Nocardiopsis terrae TaxID=372655 RepID=A0ABR9HFY8_9ACTN|nr:UvrD-helicase domain-containing protein [Nocardiopsis terrae]MBE1457841.1 superfamily I DNA/RNA helicase [Nocardiopsis terrae]GHC83991.1 DNA helicase [Nocardiopsis terrae]